MPRDQELHFTRIAAGLRIGMIAALSTAGLATISLRGTAGDPRQSDDRSVALGDDSQPRVAQNKKAAAGTGKSDKAAPNDAASSSKVAVGKSEPLSVAWVPADAVGVAAIRPSDLLDRPVLEPLKKLLTEQRLIPGTSSVSPARIEQAVAVLLLNSGKGADRGVTEPSLIVRLTDSDDATKLIQSVQPNPETVSHAGTTYVKGKEDFGPICFQPDAKTVVVCRDEADVRRIIAAGKEGASKSKWAALWKTVAGADAALYCDTGALRSIIQTGLKANPEVASQFAAFSPLWQATKNATLTLDCREDPRVVLIASATTSKDAARVKKTLEAALTFGKNALAQFRQLPGGDGTPIQRAVDLGTAFLNSVQSTQKQDQVRAEATIAATQATTVIAAMVPALTAAQDAARRSQSKNNLKQLALAMYNYESAKGTFPAAILYGPDGKTPYSWRVAVLPYLDANWLYEQYKFDEPWDGPNNKKLLAKMPDVFRDPNDPPESPTTSYFAITGPTTIFNGKSGAKIAQITDGTSNTLMFVEAQRDIPWTKPEDISYEKDKPLPALGGHFPGIFLAALCDGSVRAISQQIDPNLLRALVTKDGGEVVNVVNVPGETP